MLKYVSEFVHQALEELHQVRWPTRQQAVRLSGIVVVFVFASAILFGITDFLLARLVKLLLSFT